MVVHFAAESHVDNSLHDPSPFIQHEPDRHLHDPRGRPQARRAPASHLHRRGVRRPRPRGRRPVHRGHQVRPVLAVFRHQGGLGPAGAGVGALVRRARHAVELREQLRAVPARREVHPAPDHERLQRRAPEALRRRRERARVDPRRRPQRGRPPDPEQGRARRDLPDRLRRRALQQGDPRADPRRARRARRRVRPRAGPPGPRPALLQRLDEDPHPARLDRRATATSARAWRRRSSGTATTTGGGGRRRTPPRHVTRSSGASCRARSRAIRRSP